LQRLHSTSSRPKPPNIQELSFLPFLTVETLVCCTLLGDEGSSVLRYLKEMKGLWDWNRSELGQVINSHNRDCEIGL
jgi:hypothetical protein